MDGLLLNTEDLITTCTNIVLHKYGKQDLPWSVKARVQGRTAEESSRVLLEWAKLPIYPDDFKKQFNLLHERIFPTSEPLPGVSELLQRLEAIPGVNLALATSSAKAEFEIKTAGCKSLFRCFPEDCRVLGDDPRVEHHKPAPDIYICALRCVNEKLAEGDMEGSINAGQCLVFEDSIQGVDAGRRAGMQVVWCPHLGLLQEILQGDPASIDVRENLGAVLGLNTETPIRGLEISALADCIYEATDGWVRLLNTLEDFPYVQYGLEA